MQRAPSKRWASGASKTKYDDWSDEEFDEEEEDEILSENQELEAKFVAEKALLVQNNGITEKLEHQKEDDSGHNNDQKSEHKSEDNSHLESAEEINIHIKHNIVTKQPVENVTVTTDTASTKQDLPKILATNPELPIIADSKVALETPISADASAASASNISNATAADDSLVEYEKELELEQQERHLRLEKMEDLYKSISNQLSESGISLEDDDDAAVIAPVAFVAPNAVSKSRVAAQEAAVHAGDLSALDKDFDDLFENFENLSFSAAGTPQRKNSETVASIALDHEPIINEYPDKSRNSDDGGADFINELNVPKTRSTWSPLEVNSVAKTMKNVHSLGGSENDGVDNGVEKGIVKSMSENKSFDNVHSFENEPSLESKASYEKKNNFENVPVFEKKHSFEEKNILEKKSSLENEDKNKDQGLIYSSSESESENESEVKNVTKTDAGFSAGKGLWGKAPTLKDATPQSPADSYTDSIVESISVDNAEEEKKFVQITSPMSESDFGTPTISDEKVFGDNFPSNSLDEDQIYTDDYSEFRTSIYRNDFVDRTKRVHEAFNASVLPASTIEAAASSGVNTDSMKKVYKSETVSSTQSKDDFSEDVLYAKEYLQYAENSNEEDSDEEEDSDNFAASNASKGLWGAKDKFVESNLESKVESKVEPKIEPKVESKPEAKIESKPEPSKINTKQSVLENTSPILSDNVQSPESAASSSSFNTPIQKKPSFDEVLASLVMKQKMGSVTSTANKRTSELISVVNSDEASHNRTLSNVSEEVANATNTPVMQTGSNFDNDATVETTPIRQEPGADSNEFNFETPKKDDSPAVPPKDPEMFSPRQHKPLSHGMSSIGNQTGEVVHEVLRKVRKDEYHHDSGLQIWLEATLKATNTTPMISATEIGPNTKAAYAIAQQQSVSMNNGSGNARRMSLNSKINISGHRFIKGTKSVNKNVKGKLEEGFARGIFKRKR